MVPNNTFFSQPIFINKPTPVEDLKLQGENGKKTLIVTSELTEPELALLNKILSAVKYDLAEDCHLIYLPKEQQITMHQLLTENAYQKVICFGIKALQLGFNWRVRNYRPVSLENCTFIFSDSIGKINSEKSLKAALWNSLQKVFK